RAPVNRAIPPESARNGKNPKLQTPLFGNMPPSALSGIVVQTFLSVCRRLTGGRRRSRTLAMRLCCVVTGIAYFG
ncbi:hypothetical protein, partial [Xanthomonas vasicola]|uniref:hypothetical protein n=2 Tax=Xanthomonas vasicola TaxID=56459 RepID=UPI001D0C2D48